ALDGLAPRAGVHGVVPVGDDVPERAALVAEGDAAIHAARALRAQHLFRRLFLDLPPVLEARRDRLLVNLFALELDEARDLAHGARLVRRRRGVQPRCRGAASRAPWHTRPA